MKVHEIMTAHARCVAPENTLVEAAGLMRELDVGVLPVCDNDRLAGMVTDRDIVLRGVADGRDAYNTTVRDVMSAGVLYVFADQEVEAATRVMEEKQVRRLPVLNREKRLVGIMSLGDLAVRSNPAFSGQALREVSESPEEHMRGGRTAGSVRDERARARMGEAPKSSRRIPAGARKTSGRAGKSDARKPAGAKSRRSRANQRGNSTGGRNAGANRQRGVRAGSARSSRAKGGARGAAASGAKRHSRRGSTARRGRGKAA